MKPNFSRFCYISRVKFGASDKEEQEIVFMEEYWIELSRGILVCATLEPQECQLCQEDKCAFRRWCPICGMLIAA